MSCKFPADMLQASFNITTGNMDYLGAEVESNELHLLALL